jgi:hypothetical protein
MMTAPLLLALSASAHLLLRGGMPPPACVARRAVSRMEIVTINPSVQEAFDDAAKASGAVDRAALRKVLASYGNPSDASDVLRAYDEDQSGEVDINEFARIINVLEATKAIQTAGGDSAPVGGQVGEIAYNTVSSWARTLVQVDDDPTRRDREERGVSLALRRMQRDMSMLDQAAGSTPQLSPLELFLLSSAVATSFFSPFALTSKAVEVLVPSMSALCATIGFSAE